LDPATKTILARISIFINKVFWFSVIQNMQPDPDDFGPPADEAGGFASPAFVNCRCNRPGCTPHRRG
jgi:hypothetical protein